MRIKLLSDLHLESHPYWDYIPKVEDADVLILAGDITSGKLPYKFADFVTGIFSKVIYVFGNHEYYGQDITTFAAEAKDYLTKWPGITVLDNESLTVGAIKLIGTTLWTDMDRENPISKMNIQRMLSDYYVIGCGKRKLIADDTISLHKIAKDYIESELKADELKKVVITHHCPSMMSVHSKFRGSSVNGAFCSSLDNLFRPEYNLAMWTHGHTHQRVWYAINGARVRNNPKGYGQENPSFDPSLTFDV